MGQCNSRQKAGEETRGTHPTKQKKSKSIFKKKQKSTSKRQVQFIPDVTEATSSEAEDNVVGTPYTVGTDLTESEVQTPKSMSLSSLIHSSNGSRRSFPSTPLVTLQEDLEDAIPEEEDPEAPSDEEDAHEESLNTPPDEPGRLEPVRIRLRNMVSPESVQLVAPSPDQATALTQEMSKVTRLAVAPSTVSHFQRLKLKIQLADQQKKQELRARKLEDRLQDVKEYRKLYADFKVMNQEAKSAGKPRERSDSFDLKNSENWYFDFQAVDFAYEGEEEDNASQTNLSLLSETSMEAQRKYFESKRQRSKKKSRQKATTPPAKTEAHAIEIDTTPVTRNGGALHDYGPTQSCSVGPTDMEVSFDMDLQKDDDRSLVSDLGDDNSTLMSYDYGVVRRKRRTINPDDTSIGSSSRLSRSIASNRRSQKDREAFSNRLSSLEATVASMASAGPPDIHRLIDENSLPPESNSNPGEFQVLGLAGPMRHKQLMERFNNAESPEGKGGARDSSPNDASATTSEAPRRHVSPEQPRKPSQLLYDDMGNRIWKPMRSDAGRSAEESSITTTEPTRVAVVSPESTMGAVNEEAMDSTKGILNDEGNDSSFSATRPSETAATPIKSVIAAVQEESPKDAVSADLPSKVEEALSSAETNDATEMPSDPEKSYTADLPEMPPARKVTSEQAEIPVDPILSFWSSGTDEDELEVEPEKSFSSTIIDQDGLPPEPAESFSFAGDDFPPEPVKSFSTDGSEMPPEPVESFSFTEQDEAPIESTNPSDGGVALLSKAKQATESRSEAAESVNLHGEAVATCAQVEDESHLVSTQVAFLRNDQEEDIAVNEEEEVTMEGVTMTGEGKVSLVAAPEKSSDGAEDSSEIGIKDTGLSNAEVSPVKKLFHDSDADSLQKDKMESTEVKSKSAKHELVKRVFNPLIASMTTEEFLGMAEQNPLARAARIDCGDDDIPSDEERVDSGVKSSRETATAGHYSCELSKDESDIGEETLLLADKVASEVRDVLTKYRSYDDFLSEGSTTNPLIADHEKEKLYSA